MDLSAPQCRLLGSLIEKEITTPEVYPLSLNALLAAANQRSSRDPVMDLDETVTREALSGLEEMGLVTPVRDARVLKFEHRARTVLHLRRDETALVCLLLLRGPQTPGELRSRADRLFQFDDLPAVVSALERLARRPPASEVDTATGHPSTGPLVVVLPRQPGAREARFLHLLSRATAAPALANPAAPLPEMGHDAEDRLNVLEQEVRGLREAVAGLREDLAELRSRVDAPSPSAKEPGVSTGASG